MYFTHFLPEAKTVNFQVSDFPAVTRPCTAKISTESSHRKHHVCVTARK